VHRRADPPLLPGVTSAIRDRHFIHLGFVEHPGHPRTPSRCRNHSHPICRKKASMPCPRRSATLRPGNNPARADAQIGRCLGTPWRFRIENASPQGCKAPRGSSGMKTLVEPGRAGATLRRCVRMTSPASPSSAGPGAGSAKLAVMLSRGNAGSGTAKSGAIRPACPHDRARSSGQEPRSAREYLQQSCIPRLRANCHDFPRPQPAAVVCRKMRPRGTPGPRTIPP